MNKINFFSLSKTIGGLKYLYLDYNQFRSFKSIDFTLLSNLTTLYLDYNPHAFPNEIADHLKPLVNLIELGLRNLSISSMDSSFFKQNTNLGYLYLSNNKISVLL